MTKRSILVLLAAVIFFVPVCVPAQWFIERFQRTDFGHMDIAITIDDPKAYTKPWTANMKVTLLPDTELSETTCENSKGTEHMVGK